MTRFGAYIVDSAVLKRQLWSQGARGRLAKMTPLEAMAIHLFVLDKWEEWGIIDKIWANKLIFMETKDVLETQQVSPDTSPSLSPSVYPTLPAVLCSSLSSPFWD